MWLKKIRRRKGYRQSDLAMAISMPEPLISYIENGMALPTRDKLLRIEEVLKVSRYDLFDEVELDLHDKKRRIRKDFSSYHVHIKLPKKFKKVLNQKNFRRAGYKNMNDWFLYKVKQFIVQNKIIEDYAYFKKFYEERQKQKEKAQSVRPDVPLIATNPEQRKAAPHIILENAGKDKL